MQHELNLFDFSKSEKEIILAAFDAIDQGIRTIFVPTYYASKLKSLVGKSVNIACPVDYPAGLSETSIRQHACISAINHGADFIDLVVNPLYLLNGEKQALIEDLIVIKGICSLKNKELRVILDYRMFSDSLIFSVANIVQNVGIKHIIPSSGLFVEDYLDNIIMCQLIANKNPSIKTVFNSVRCTQEQYDKIKESRIHCLRLKSFSSLQLVYT